MPSCQNLGVLVHSLIVLGNSASHFLEMTMLLVR